RQALATALSYVGNYDEAQKYFDEPDSSGSRFEENIKLDEMEALDAREAIINEAYNRRVVMLNEAHHVPETRGLTMALLKPLFDQGYRYFAAETFQEIGLKETIKKGFPMLETGYYIAEPLFADIVREALRIGYTLVPY